VERIGCDTIRFIVFRLFTERNLNEDIGSVEAMVEAAMALRAGVGCVRSPGRSSRSPQETSFRGFQRAHSLLTQPSIRPFGPRRLERGDRLFRVIDVGVVTRMIVSCVEH
jgi:hypothetical protein